MADARKPFHETVAEKLIEQLKQGTAPWQRPWEPGEPSAFVPMNPTTGKRYRGVNAVFLMAQSRTDQRWLTYNQANAINAQVKKGERGTPIQYWKFEDELQRVDSAGNPVLDGSGKPVMQRVKLERPRVFFATVFNAEQIDGMPPLQQRERDQRWTAMERAEAILTASGAVIKHGEQNSAFYRPATDSIHLPDRTQFPTADNYYATALHELGHWTGHESRLSRDLANPFGSVGYAKEELRAEIASMILGDELGIGHDTGQHAAYVNSWIQLLQDDPMEIVRAAADAEKIQDFVLGLEQQQSQQQSSAMRQPLRPSVIELTATQYEEMTATDRQLQTELIRAYGEANAGDARYRLTHEDEAVQEAAEAFRTAAAAWHAAVAEARIIVDRQPAQAQENQMPRDLPAGPQLARLLSTLTRETRFGQQADPVAKDIVTSASYQRLALRLEELGIRPTAVLGAGASSVVLDTNRGALRLGLGEPAGPFVSPHVIRALQRGSVGGLRYELMPKADTADITQADVDAMSALLLGEGLRFSDAGTDNLGRVNGRLVVIDPGAIGDAHHRHAPAFFANDEQLRDRSTGIVVPEDWTGLAQNGQTFIYVGQEAGQRTRTTLASTTLTDAELEAKTVKALQVDIGQVLTNPDVSFEHFVAYQGETLEAALRSRGLTMIGSVVGSEPALFHFRAIERLSAAFGVDPSHEETDNAYLERKGLAQEIAQRAEHLLAQFHTAEVALARQNEDLVRDDSESSDEAREQAKESRKYAELRQAQAAPDYLDRLAAVDQEEFRMAEAAQDPSNQSSDTQGQPANGAQTNMTEQFNRIDVPFKEKDEAKALGAKWDAGQKSWYVPAGLDVALFAKWVPSAVLSVPPGPMPAREGADLPAPRESNSQRTFLAVPYGERDLAKRHGALWDNKAKAWYVGPKGDAEQLARWAFDGANPVQGPADTPQQEFASALRAMGFLLPEGHPIMDGTPHRVPVVGDKKGETAGFYIGHEDGHPAGYIMNNMTGLEMKWKSKGYTLDPEEKVALQAAAATKLEARANEQAALHAGSARALERQLQLLRPVEQGHPTPYLVTKGINVHAGVFSDSEARTTFVPATDTGGRLWTMQYIQEDGTKRFAKNSRKDGCFHAVGGFDSLAVAPAIVIAEGYATAATLSEVLGFATVAAFDAGNLPAVATALKAKFPDKPVVIAGDDDRHQELTQGGNPGRTKAMEAAAAVDGKVMIPIFAPGEGTYPSGVEPITPKTYRVHVAAKNELEKAAESGVHLTDGRIEELKSAMLGAEQLAGLAHMKKHTDFNDLATKSIFGRDGVERQARAVVDSALQKHQSKNQLQQEEQSLVPSENSQRGQSVEGKAPSPRRRRAAAKP